MFIPFPSYASQPLQKHITIFFSFGIEVEEKVSSLDDKEGNNVFGV
jgi:hypothetical protein